jgi:hypothetical protein
MSSTVTETLKLVFEAAWNVLWVGIVLGAGLPLMFALGVRAMAPTTITGPDGTTSTVAGPSWGKVVAVLCFLVCLYGVVTGIMVIVGGGQGKIVEFHNLFPTLVPKPH